MKNRKLLLIVSLVLALTMAMGSTLAYLTDTDEAVNVMTLGNVDIEQYEKDAEGNPFVQSQPLYPAYEDGTDVVGEIEKVVTVENTGSSDAYVRTWMAFEAGKVTDLTAFRELIKAEFGFAEDEIHWQETPVQIEDQKYFVAYVVYPEAVKPGEETTESLKSVYMAPTAGNADVAQFGETYEILVLSEAVQTKNMEAIGAEKALEAAFGTDHPWQEGLNGDVNPQLPTKVVKTAEELREALKAGGTTVVLANDIELDADETIVIAKGVSARLDLAGYTLSGQADGAGNREMFLVKGNLTVNDGNMEMMVTRNQGWDAMSTIFDVTDGGVLNLKGVTAENLGGTDMAFVAHLNNWGEVTLNVNDSNLKSPYVAVRAFNSGYDMNNISIHDSVVEGGNYSLWVHNYTLADFGGDQAKHEAAKARLNFDVLDESNVYVGGFRYGMTNKIVDDEMSVDLVIDSAEKLFDFAEAVNGGDSFSGKTVVLTADIDLKNQDWEPIGQTGAPQFQGTFDGMGYTISNLNVDSLAETGGYYSSGLFGWLNAATVRNVKVDGATVKGNHNVAVIAGYLETKGCTVSNCHVSNATVVGKHANDDACGDKVAVIVGHAGNDGVKVEECSASNCTVTAGRDAGQIVGAAKTANVVDCAATDVTVTDGGDCNGKNINEAVIGRIL